MLNGTKLFFLRESKKKHPIPSITHTPQLMLKKKTAVKDGSVVLPGFFFSYSDLVLEEPTKTAIVLYSLELASFLFFNIEA